MPFAGTLDGKRGYNLYFWETGELIRDGVDLSFQRRQVVKWILQSSFTEELQGRPDHAAVRMIDELTSKLASGEELPQLNALDVDTKEIVLKRFLRGKAMSIAYVEILIRRGLFADLPLYIHSVRTVRSNF
jgi:hypothetical protein